MLGLLRAGRTYWPPPALGERRHRSLARWLITVRRPAYVTVVAAGPQGRLYGAIGTKADNEMILDIGSRSIEHVCSVLARVKTLVWNGPFGAFELEPFDIGTVEITEAAAELTGAGKLVTVAGGGDTVAALNAAGATDRFTYVSTAGGAFLEWLEGKPLPGVEVLRVR
jgi:3-phosphoglycerate kinase